MPLHLERFLAGWLSGFVQEKVWVPDLGFVQMDICMPCFGATKTGRCPVALVGMYYDHDRIRIHMSRAELTGSCAR